MRTDPSDWRWLDAAARLALRGRPLSRPNPAVGCILVRGGRVVGRGWTQPGGRPHAEAMALRQAAATAAGATAYVTLEPCAHASKRGPACADSLIAAGVTRVVVGVRDPDPRTAGQGLARLAAAGIEVAVATGAAAQTAADSLAGYLTRAARGRPHVTLKLALSLDGCLARADGESRWITGPEARAHAHARRALADAILVGGETWRRDTPSLDVRLPGLEERSPRRLVLSRHPVAGAERIASPDALFAEGSDLYLYAEGGAGAAAALLAADAVDRLELYRAPILIGGGRPALADIGLARLADAHGRWTLVESAALGSDRFDAYQRRR